MHMNTHGNNEKLRNQLGFAEAVTAHIAPILATEAFVCTEATESIVKFESPKVVLSLSHNRRDYQIEVALILRANPLLKCTLHDIVNAECGPNGKEQSFFQASNPDRIVACAQAIAEVLTKYGQSVLAGEPVAFERTVKLARLRDEKFTKRVVQQPILKAAEEAWGRRDYGKVRTLYESIEKDLGPVEQNRLKYAKDH